MSCSYADLSCMGPADSATDDVLVLVFRALAQGFCSPDALASPSHKLAAARFTWFRTTLPLVCRRWHRLVLSTPSLWSCCIINPAAEAQAARRSSKHQQHQQHQQGSEPVAGASPVRINRFYDAVERSTSGYSTPTRGASPLLGSSPDSDSGAYWNSQYAPYAGLGGASPRHITQRLSHLSTARQQARLTLSSAAVAAWLTAHAAAASGINALRLDLSHHLGNHDFDTTSLDAVLQQLPQVTAVRMAGAVEGTDAYEPLARLRHLRSLELSSASQACLDAGLLALCFLPRLHTLSVSLDIPPASPMSLLDLPSSLHSLRLCAMWLEELPKQIIDCVGLTKIVLEQCQVEHNPLPLLLLLPHLATIKIRSASRGSSDDSLPALLPMQRPQRQVPMLHANRSAAARPSIHAGIAAAAVASMDAEAADCACFNTSITSLSLVDVGLRQLPSCVSQLMALQELQLALNHDMALNPASCLPNELTSLTGLRSLGLGNCSLHYLPPVVATLSSLTRLEIQGNALSAAGFSISGLEPSLIGFAHSLRVLDLTAQGSGRSRMRGIPAWVGQCAVLTELRLGCSCLGYHGDCVSSSLTSAMASASASASSMYPGQQQAAHVSGSRALHHSSSDVGLGHHRGRSEARGCANMGANTARSSPDLGHAASAPPAMPTAPRPATTAAACAEKGVRGASAGLSNLSTSSQTLGGPDGLCLQHLPTLLPDLQLLVIEGGVWEQRAVRDALQLMRRLVECGSSLQLVLPL